MAAAVIRSSTNVFHCWHEGHRPIHFGEVAPHCWHTYWVLLFTLPLLLHRRGPIKDHPDGDPIWEVMTFRREAATEYSPGSQGCCPAAKRRETIAQRASAGVVFVHVIAPKARQI